MGVMTCAKIESVELDPDEGGATRMRGGVRFLTLPAGYLGSSLIGAILIACGFDERASKVASIVIGVFFLFMLWWARRNWLYVWRQRTHIEHGFLFSSWSACLPCSGYVLLFAHTSLWRARWLCGTLSCSLYVSWADLRA